MSSAIDVGDRYDMRACGEGLEDYGRGSRAGREGESVTRMFERGDCGFEIRSIWVCAARILV